jgi:hypothetical protein
MTKDSEKFITKNVLNEMEFEKNARKHKIDNSLTRSSLASNGWKRMRKKDGIPSSSFSIFYVGRISNQFYISLFVFSLF